MSLKRAVLGAVTTYLDPCARDVAVNRWPSTERISGRAFDAFAGAARLSAEDRRMLTTLGEKDAVALYERLEEIYPKATVVDLVASAQEITERTGIIFYRSDRQQVNVLPHRGDPRDNTVQIVIPYRGTVRTPLRERNLVAVLSGLANQSLGRGMYQVTIVEESTESRIPAVVRAQVDRVIRIAYDGPFNRSLAMNQGVAGATFGDVLCLLDGDIYPDTNFLLRNLLRVIGDEAAAHLPYTDMFHLLEPDTKAVLRNGTVGGEPHHGYLVPHPPGGCLWITRDLFSSSGGYDESFAGWGGEDREFIDRITGRIPVSRHSELLVHLNHERPRVHTA